MLYDWDEQAAAPGLNAAHAWLVYFFYGPCDNNYSFYMLKNC